MSELGPEAHHVAQDQAIAWCIRLRDGTGDDWAAFVRWLEVDPAHLVAYDEIAVADQDILAAAFSKSPANDRERGESGWNAPFRGRAALVAGLAVMLVIGMLFLPGQFVAQSRYEVATSAGQHLIVPLAGGGTAALNGATRLILDRNRPAYAELARGEATFTIRHDPARSFIVAVGGQQLVDIGTRFNVIRDGGRVAVDVIDGAVRLDRDRQSVDLEVGRTASIEENTGHVVLGRKAPEAMAAWQSGRLSYSATPLAIVASDLSRNLGTDVRIAPAIRVTPFTGSISLSGGPAGAVNRFALVAGLHARPEAGGWTLEPPARAVR